MIRAEDKQPELRMSSLIPRCESRLCVCAFLSMCVCYIIQSTALRDFLSVWLRRLDSDLSLGACFSSHSLFLFLFFFLLYDSQIFSLDMPNASVHSCADTIVQTDGQRCPLVELFRVNSFGRNISWCTAGKTSFPCWKCLVPFTFLSIWSLLPDNFWLISSFSWHRSLTLFPMTSPLDFIFLFHWSFCWHHSPFHPLLSKLLFFPPAWDQKQRKVTLQSISLSLHYHHINMHTRKKFENQTAISLKTLKEFPLHCTEKPLFTTNMTQPLR